MCASQRPCQILLDDRRPGQPALRRFAEPKEIIEAHTPADVRATLARIDQAIRAGHFAAGYFSYELGYALEPRLMPCHWAGHIAPLLWFGIFDRCDELDAMAAEYALATDTRAYAGPLQHDWNESAYRER